MSKTRRQVQVLMLMFSILFFVSALFAQETTGGLQGTVKDPSGAVVPGAKVVLTAPNLPGSKETTSDSNGYYRLTNLPPSTYTVTVNKENFATLKREGVTIEVGHLPTLDLPLQVGGSGTVVEVTEEAPLIDVTSTRTMTNITQDVIQDVPHGRSFQSVIQFAPSARNEPLAGNAVQSNGSGGSSPGSTTNGSDHGFQVAGGSDSENSYLVEGQETANIIGGYSHTNVPFDFIQEVQTKSSGIEAEHGGALGGVVNVIMKKGTNQYHGTAFLQFENDSMDGSPVAYSRYDPQSSGTPLSWGTADPAYQNYQPIKPHTSDFFPGFTFGGPIWKDKIFGFLAFNPEMNRYERFVNYGPSAGGILPFSTNTNTYYTTARIDSTITQKIRVYGSWLYQYQRQNGQALPGSDSVNGLFNVSSGCYGRTDQPCSTGIPTFAFAHNLGYAAPNSTTNVGADWTITNTLVSTTRFGYYFENYHDFGYPTTGTIDAFSSSGTGTTEDTNGNLISNSAPQLAHDTGFFNLAQNQNFTTHNANKAIQFDQDIAWFKSGWGGTHNFKFGYQMNRLSNDINQHYNTPYVSVYPGTAVPYSPQGKTGGDNCATVEGITGSSDCVGTYGVVNVLDYGSSGKATSYNHAFFAQDAWTIGHGITINAGIRFEHEYLPAENQPSGSSSKPINFGWGDKIAPRIGAAWDVFKDGRMKVFGSYGQFYDQMKLNLAISSYGGQYWQNCYYALMTPDLSSVSPIFDGSNRYCSGPDSSSQANFATPPTSSQLIFLENQNFRTFPTSCSTCSSSAEGTAPGIKPYKQHESVFGVDYEISRRLGFEARWDRRRVDNVIEDSAIYNSNVGETFVIVNPGEGVDSTFSKFWSFLYPGAPLTAADCAPNPCPGNIVKASRAYDGLEFRLTKAQSNHWFGMFSYTYSKLRGNYTGLTSTDVADGGGGRNAPNNSRSFDEPMFSWNALGGSSSGLLPTDRPNAFKGYAYYELPWLKHFTTDFGIFQFAYSGTPLTSYADVGYGFPGAFPVDIVDRGKWVDITQDPTTGAISVSNPYTRRTPWYTQTDFNLQQTWKISESKALSFSATFTNLWNQHATVSYGQQVDSNFTQQWINPQNAGCGTANQGLFGDPLGGDCYVFDGAVAYAAYAQPYDYKALLNQSALISQNGGGPITNNTQYGKPYLFQQPRGIRLGLRFTF
ncbi:TonB-dependent receptor [Candidatus Koribacter versatilis Ellin345]|uniref:TonB-dependent receptor n=1 Tax=Koribacter versatilis (strain Ellin345) TaxID=204669 RepID=Q1IN74_KORVE|nr:carboxypeptidase regulatory-like domain-containing protein [Candidatus Koribacter versatilis]ABF41676.1 TonB-dependent receptor [Candidatus Koribacter versatilis Ellin345]